MIKRRKRIGFGQTITELRRMKGLNQRDLAARIRKEDGSTISQQYLNDIEHDRRNPSSDSLISSLARALEVDPAFLSYIAGQMPPELRDLADDPETLRHAIEAFRTALRQARSR